MNNREGGIQVPKIVTTRARRKTVREKVGAPTAAPFRLVISRPVPHLFEEASVVRAAAATPPAMSLSADRTNYVVSESEFPTYALTGGAPSHTILWSLWRNGVM